MREPPPMQTVDVPKWILPAILWFMVVFAFFMGAGILYDVLHPSPPNQITQDASPHDNGMNLMWLIPLLAIPSN